MGLRGRETKKRCRPSDEGRGGDVCTLNKDQVLSSVFIPLELFERGGSGLDRGSS